MDKFEGYIFTALCSTNFLVSCLIFSKVTREQREPYMDEIFHVPQAQKYCHGKFNQWDPMITTLPGLYLVSVGIIKPVVRLANMTGDVVCSTAMLRFINLLFNCGNLYLLYRLVCRLHPKDKTRTTARRILSALSLSTFPVLYFFNFLYYTDAGSTFFTLFTYVMTLHGCHKASALLAACAVFFRQTNIVWVAFCAGTLVANQMDDAWRAAHSKKTDDRSAKLQVPISLIGFKRVAFFTLEFFTSAGHLKSVLSVTWPYAAVAAGFLVFIWQNGGVVVGDRANHEACLNFPQIFYFFCFSFFFSLPVSLCHHRVRRFLQAMKRQPVLFLLATIVSVLLVWKFTAVHKYLLADNRHFTFYVWKRFFQRHEVLRFLLIPIYIFAAWHFQDSLKSRSLFWTLAFLACVAAATVPQKLLEFRYFIIPYLMYRLHMPLPSTPRLVLEFLLYTAVNAATLYIFVTKTFRWPDSAATQRFMW
ncbi:dol-P-Glc:Glc(2)Man(9)GlcNAc(2)-PP-Dol alpha-1,2-glucosyltransferase isoform X1 [Corythoichthys intestinalis]|uniref:dol-P-Glc:Glc(2)Man(9)GlcNAc(2)-PP-Dol alpha-1,2-glucosyltransferase isoform X1 n=2 Tax=Corythoichthys intestinalis TaxID=161448 RepID=UPI0025A67C6D|nr:dol-P-Glc:Glc(2)Man(9)GlcNAc(2)-PP-Dol alpha-1,2-glucosyltransferase isoform X1 [Corythoichthys intestinalis]XP_061809114.1 putative Dol-P-Glc:Glc(2)Man(9)GlcNAc(2)-PP-Dol alpha-1,2-glucosyltransferase isoform X2 [Nerophis lumbriciformis]